MINKINLTLSIEEIKVLLFCINAYTKILKAFIKTNPQIETRYDQLILLKKRLINLINTIDENQEIKKYHKKDKLGNLYDKTGKLNINFE